MNARWSLLDLVALSVIGISCGALFAGWNLLWGALTPLFALVLPLQYLLLAGTWVIAGPLAGLIIKRRGAALFGELIAASVSFLLASQWSIDALFSGAAQGLGAEVVFLLFGYRVWGWPWSLPLARPPVLAWRCMICRSTSQGLMQATPRCWRRR